MRGHRRKGVEADESGDLYFEDKRLTFERKTEAGDIIVVDDHGRFRVRFYGPNFERMEMSYQFDNPIPRSIIDEIAARGLAREKKDVRQ